MEILAAHAADGRRFQRIDQSVDGMHYHHGSIGIMKNEGILKEVMSTVMIKIEEHLKHRAGDGLEMVQSCFPKKWEFLARLLMQTDLLQKIQSRKKKV